MHDGQSSSRNGGIALLWYRIRQRFPNHLQIGPLCVCVCVRPRAYTHTRTHARSLAHSLSHTPSLSLASSILPFLEAPAKGFFFNLPEFGRCIPFDDLHGCEMCPLVAHFRGREEAKFSRSEILRVRWLGDGRHVLLDEDIQTDRQADGCGQNWSYRQAERPVPYRRPFILVLLRFRVERIASAEVVLDL
jgi:hypothetical protein